jgi:hypothetical protein
VVRANRDEICPRLGIIIIRQPDGPAVVDGGVVRRSIVHGFLLGVIRRGSACRTPRPSSRIKIPWKCFGITTNLSNSCGKNWRGFRPKYPRRFSHIRWVAWWRTHRARRAAPLQFHHVPTISTLWLAMEREIMVNLAAYP